MEALSSFEKNSSAQYTLLQLEKAASLDRLDNDTVTAAPLFSARYAESEVEGLSSIPEFGLLAGNLNAGPGTDSRIFLNVYAPWSAFICGSQGSGKSHTLSCILENCLLKDDRIGHLAKPLTGLVFHYDSFNSHFGGQPCEAAYLVSAGIPVTVLVSLSNLHRMRQIYQKLDPRITVVPLLIHERYLTSETLLTLMAADTTDGPQPLYMQTVLQVLREMALSEEQLLGIDYQRFKLSVLDKIGAPTQLTPLLMRLELVESFILDQRKNVKRKKKHLGNDWSPKSGELTIVDLSCPFTDSDTACGLFEICLGIFLMQDPGIGRIIALDEAHKFMNKSQSADKLAEAIKSVIRLQRHLGSRIVVATQEPTIAPSLLDLCSITVIHRFSSPAWFNALRVHLAAMAKESGEDSRTWGERTFRKIATLRTGQALLCSPSAVLGSQNGHGEESPGAPPELGTGFLHIKVRHRISEDGGKSILNNG